MIGEETMTERNAREARLSGLRLGAAIVGLALPFAIALPASAMPSPNDVAAAEGTCIALGYDTSTCSEAVEVGVSDVAEDEVNGSLAASGIDYSVEVLGEADLTPNSGNPGVPANPNV
jgi:hypothetical protein